MNRALMSCLAVTAVSIVLLYFELTPPAGREELATESGPSDQVGGGASLLAPRRDSEFDLGAGLSSSRESDTDGDRAPYQWKFSEDWQTKIRPWLPDELMHDKAAANIAIHLHNIESQMRRNPGTFHEAYVTSFSDMLERMAPDAAPELVAELKDMDSYHRGLIGRGNVAIERSRSVHLLAQLEANTAPSVSHPESVMSLAEMYRAGRAVTEEQRARAARDQEAQRTAARERSGFSEQDSAVFQVSGQDPYTHRFIVLNIVDQNDYFAALAELRVLRQRRMQAWQQLLGR